MVKDDDLERIRNSNLPESTRKAFLILAKAGLLPEDDYPTTPTVTEVEFGFMDLQNDRTAARIVRIIELAFGISIEDSVRWASAEVQCQECNEKSFGVIVCLKGEHIYYRACVRCNYKQKFSTHAFLDQCPHIYQKLDDSTKK